jgi:predicted permease
VSLDQAQAEVAGILAEIAREHPQSNKGIGVRLRPIREQAFESTAEFTLLLFGAAMFVFLMSCVNVANLLLSRATTRAKEVAIRLALGASRRRVIRQLVIESLGLGLVGGVGGFLLALWGNDAILAAIPHQIPFWLRFDFDARVFGFIVVLSFASTLISGLLPAVKASQPDLLTELKDGGRSVETSGPRAIRLRNILVVSEIALALIMLVGAGLLLRSFLELRRLNPGYDARGVLTFRTGWPADMYRDDKTAPARFFDAVLTRLATLPGVETAALTNSLPGRDGVSYRGTYKIEGPTGTGPVVKTPEAQLRLVSEGYFRALRIPLLAGRGFDEAADRPDGPRVVVVDETFAVRHFGSPTAAVGRRMTESADHPITEDGPPSVSTIVGVAANIRHHLDRPDDHPTIYVWRSQWPQNFLSVVLRTGGNPADLAEPARDAIMAVNREIPIYDVYPLEEYVLRSIRVWPLRFFSYLFTAYGAIALFLACIGIYGVVSYQVAQREQELGVRLALGAQPREIISLVVGHGARMIALGLGTGLVAAFFLVNFLGSVLYGISPRDPSTFAIVPFILTLVALLACWLPGRRATLIEPNAALRAE